MSERKRSRMAPAAFAAAWLLASASVLADPYQDGYRKGFEDGFAAGQRQARQGGVPGAAYSAPVPLHHGIAVLRASYGDGRRECNLTGMMAGRMNGRVNAELEVTNALCGDPAPGARKSLKITYSCGGEQKSADAYEHRRIHLSCP